MPLTPEEQANVDAGLTTDGREMEPCMHSAYDDDDWWADDWYMDREQDVMLDNEIQAILDDPTG